MSKSGPSSVAIRFLRWFCPAHLLEEIEGDLIQKFERDLKQFGERKAKRKFVWNVVRFFRPGILLRNRFSVELNQIYMFRNYIKIAFRHITKHKSYAFINVIGLSVGITAFSLIAAYLSLELSYDQFHPNINAIYRVELNRYVNGELVETSARTFPGVRRLLEENFPEVEHYTGFYKTPANTGFLFRYNGKIYNEPGGILNPDSAFFSVFPSLLVRGDERTVLKDPNNLILSEAIAHKLFGDKNPIGQVLESVDDHTAGSSFVVAGVMKDLPTNSHFHASIINHINYTYPESEKVDWGEGRIYTYITLSNEAQPELIQKKLNALIKKYEKENPLIKDTKMFLQPMSNIHLSSHLKDELESNGNKSFLYVLGSVGILILLIAWFNYINLEIARFVSRVKEFGLRRIIGSRKIDLALQFLVQYFILALSAILITTLTLFYLVPSVEESIGINMSNHFLINKKIAGFAIGVFLLGSLVVGSYPAIFVLRFKPIAAIKGNIQSGKNGVLVRHTLIVLQFIASSVLIAFVLVIQGQLHFMQTANKGVELEHVIAIRNPTAYSNQETQSKYQEYNQLEYKLLENHLVKSVSSSSAIPGTEIGFSYINLIKRNLGDAYDPTTYKTLFVSPSFIPTYGIHLLKGQNFPLPSENYQGKTPWKDKDWAKIILNESAIRQLGFNSPDEALNQEVYFAPFDEFLKCEIIGIVADYHHEAIKKEPYPTIFFQNYSSFQQVYFSIRLREGSNSHDAIGYIEKTWKQVQPDSPFDYFFLDEYYDQQFKSEEYIKQLFTSFAGIAIFIASLGILGMTLFQANSRLKEISIRKVLGASVTSLVVLLSRNYIRTVTLSSIIATPIIYLLINEWLSTYPERIAISVFYFLVPLGVLLAVVTITSSFQTIRAAESNPVDHLKNE